MTMHRIVLLVLVLALCATLTACPSVGAVQKAIDVAGSTAGVDPGMIGPPEPPMHGFDVVEIIVYCLAALGLAPTARVLMLLKPLIFVLLRAILGKKADMLQGIGKQQPEAPAAPAPTPETK
jgi:predicted small secreted protein